MDKKAIMLSGIAGSGKSTWAAEYVKTHPNTAILSTDDTRYTLFNTFEPTEGSQKKVIRDMMDKVAQYSAQNISVIIDTAVVVNKNRIKWYNRLRQYYKEIDLVIIDTPLEICLEQNKMRDRHVPEYVIKEMHAMKQEPDEFVKTLFTKIIKITH